MELRDAATVMLVRDGSRGQLEVFMLLRSLNLDYVGGAYVFPGGAVDPDDALIAADSSLCVVDDADISSRMGLASGASRFVVAVARECFEESGILLARRQGAPGYLDLNDPVEGPLFEGYRRALNGRQISFHEILRRENLVLSSESLVYFSHWITPKGVIRRYDTRFFLAAVPPSQVGVHDDGETVANAWVVPTEALQLRREGSFEMILPTVKNLESLGRFTTVAQALQGAREFDEIPPIMPRVSIRNGQLILLIPGQEGFDEATDDGFPPGSLLAGEINGAGPSFD